jgi:hypothetical protein
MIRILLSAVVIASVLRCTALCQENTPQLNLRADQTRRVRELARSVQDRATLLQARLEERQRELAELYNEFELDAARCQRLQADIVELQRELLANHHRMQVELRAIVDQERFLVLRQRLKYIVSPPAQVPTSPVSAPQAPSSDSSKKSNEAPAKEKS